jgi:hypothetical protein
MGWGYAMNEQQRTAESGATVWQRIPGLRADHGHMAVPCQTCRAAAGEPCRKGGDSWPEPARWPHAARRDAARLVAWWEELGR